VIAIAAGLTGCENLSDIRSEFSQSYKETLSAFDKEFSGKKAKPTPIVVEEKEEIIVLNRRAVRRLQAQLKKLGFRPGPIDGIMGGQTVRAVKKYKTAFALPASKDISAKFLRHLEGMSGREMAEELAPPQLQQKKAAELATLPLSTRSGVSARTRLSARTRTKLAPSDFPTYLAGTSFVYSNGETERVLGEKDLIVRWARGDGSTYSAFRNFLLPKSYWTDGKERGTAKVAGAPDAFWPRQEGAQVSFQAKMTMQHGNDPNSTSRRVDFWRCENNGSENITVEAGTFETFVLVCNRGADPGSPEVIRTWYYAPSVRHYVRFVEVHSESDTTESIDLVAIRPGALSWPPIVRAALTRALVHALEMPGEASRMPWTSSGVNTKVTIEAKSRFESDDGESCRKFVQIWQENNVQRHYPAIACKNASGKWAIPGLDSKTANSLATTGDLS
jgi:peptidoglycan hydrolase-like protein with peptidoglycan-binding domain